MPYKRKEDKAAQMRRYRAKKRREMQQLRIKFPDVYKAIFGRPAKPKSKKHKRKKTKKKRRKG